MSSREALARAALRLFSTRGYDAVGVQEIAGAAEVEKPTLYHFFGSKLGLLEQLFEEYATVLDRAVAEHCSAYARDLPLTLARLVSAYVDFCSERPDFYRLELGLYFAPPLSEPHRLAARHFAARHESLSAMFRVATRDHGNFRGRHERYAVTLVGMINSHLALQLQSGRAVTAAARHDIAHQFSHGIYS